MVLWNDIRDWHSSLNILAQWKNSVYALHVAKFFLIQNVGADLEGYLIAEQMKVNGSDNSGRTHVVYICRINTA